MRYATLLLLLLPGCAREATQPPAPDPASAVVRDGVEYRAETAVMESFPVQLATTVTLVNRGDEAVTLTFPDGCVVLLRAYRSAGANDPAYDAQANTVCTMALVELHIPAGDREQVQARSDAREILGDSLPDGSYHLRAVLRPNGGEVEVPAGVVELAVPR